MTAAAANLASAARTPPSPAARSIGVHLTPYAPGCSRLPPGHYRRWRFFLGETAFDVVRQTLHKLCLRPGQVRASVQANGDIALSNRDRLEPYIEGDPAHDDPAPLALLFEDITLRDVEAALTDLARRGWTPPTAGAVQ